MCYGFESIHLKVMQAVCFATCRTTFLPSEEDIGHVVTMLSAFHKDFLNRYGGLPPAGSTAAPTQKAPELVVANGVH